jgi:hypothetical protein
MGRLEAAVRDLQQAKSTATTDSSLAAVHHAFSRVLHLQGNLEQARMHAIRWQQLNPRNARATRQIQLLTKQLDKH